MAALVEEAMRAGAVGFTTCRTILHRSKHGLVPGTEAPLDELYAIAEAVGAAGHGVFEVIDDAYTTGGAHDQLVELAERGPASSPTAWPRPASPPTPTARRSSTPPTTSPNGRRIVPQVSNRPTGMLFGLAVVAAPLHHPPDLPGDGRPAARRAGRPPAPARGARRRCSPRSRRPAAASPSGSCTRFDQIFPLGDPPDYEPHPSTSIAGVAAATGRTPQEVVLDWLLERDGKALLFAPLASYVDGDHEAIREMMTTRRRCSACPTAAPTAASSATRRCPPTCSPTGCATGPGASASRSSRSVRMQTGRTARALRLRRPRHARARQARRPQRHRPRRASACTRPRWCFDLPAGGRRLVQRVDGYVATIVAGKQTFASGEPTGARPGRLVRGRPA